MKYVPKLGSISSCKTLKYCKEAENKCTVKYKNNIIYKKSTNCVHSDNYDLPQRIQKHQILISIIGTCLLFVCLSVLFIPEWGNSELEIL